jgi:hypothetical protein
MQIIKDGPWYKITRITGPKHNYLGIQIENNSTKKFNPTIQALPSVGNCHHHLLNADAILSEVLTGVSEANKELNCDFSVLSIQYVLNDTPPESIYRSLADCIIREIVRVDFEEL